MSVEQEIEGAELTAMNAFAEMTQTVGDFERGVSLIESLNFVACPPNFSDVHLISTAMAHRLVEVASSRRMQLESKCGESGRSGVGSPSQ